MSDKSPCRKYVCDPYQYPGDTGHCDRCNCTRREHDEFSEYMADELRDQQIENRRLRQEDLAAEARFPPREEW